MGLNTLPTLKNIYFSEATPQIPRCVGPPKEATFILFTVFASPMISFKLRRLKPGMIVAKPVYHHHDVLLVNEGTELTEKHIRLFKSWGITEVWIEGESKEKEKSYVILEKQAQESVEKELNEKFSEVLEDEVMAEIMKVAGKQLVKRALEQEE